MSFVHRDRSLVGLDNLDLSEDAHAVRRAERGDRGQRVVVPDLVERLAQQPDQVAGPLVADQVLPVLDQLAGDLVAGLPAEVEEVRP
jgi:hypothetical protein